MRVLLTTLVVVVLAGCGSEEPGLKKKVDQLERRVSALEHGGKRGGKRERGEGKEARAAAVDGPKGRVEIDGDATKVALLRNGSRFDVPGEVPVGAYQIIARFGEEKVEAGALEVVAGETVTVGCQSTAKTCTKQ